MMKLSLSTTDLLAQLQTTSRIASARSAVQALAGVMISAPPDARPELLEQTFADKHTTTVSTSRYGDSANPFFYCVGSQCFLPSGSDW